MVVVEVRETWHSDFLVPLVSLGFTAWPPVVSALAKANLGENGGVITRPKGSARLPDTHPELTVMRKVSAQ